MTELFNNELALLKRAVDEQEIVRWAIILTVATYLKGCSMSLTPDSHTVMPALSSIGGGLCSTPQSLTPTTTMPCSNAAKTRNVLKFAGLPQTPEPISAVSELKFTIHVL